MYDQIDNTTHDEILANIHKRNLLALNSGSGSGSGSSPICDEFDEPGRAGVTSGSGSPSDLLGEDDIAPVVNADVNLASVVNPVTGEGGAAAH